MPQHRPALALSLRLASVFFFAIMFLTASTELAPGAWVDVTLTETVGFSGILVLV